MDDDLMEAFLRGLSRPDVLTRDEATGELRKLNAEERAQFGMADGFDLGPEAP